MSMELTDFVRIPIIIKKRTIQNDLWNKCHSHLTETLAIGSILQQDIEFKHSSKLDKGYLKQKEANGALKNYSLNSSHWRSESSGTTTGRTR